MIRNISLGQYFPGESPIHKMDPRVKIVLTFVLMIAVFVTETFMDFLMFAFFAAIIIAVSDVHFKYTVRGLKPVMAIIVFTTVINMFYIKGTPIFKFGVFEISYEG